MSFLDRIAECARFDSAAYRPFVIGDVAVGFVEPWFATLLAAFPAVFDCEGDAVRLAPTLDEPAARSGAVHGALSSLRRQAVFVGWRDEPYPVFAPATGAVLMTIERACVPRFGIIATGVHLNGIVEDEAGLSMWIGRRSLDRPMAPGKLDQLVAGGRAAGYGVFETLLKEAAEEAGLAAALVAKAQPAGVISYATARAEGLRRDILFVYDLVLPAGWVPVNRDDEIAEFYLWTIERVAAVVRETCEFKFNCALVVIDFLIRRGLIAADEPDYARINQGLRAGALAALALGHRLPAPGVPL